MKIDDFLEFNKYDLEDCITNNPTTFTVVTLIPAIKGIIIILEELRTSEGRTENVIKDILNRYKRKKAIGGHYDESGDKVPDTFIYERTVESDIFQMWLLKFCGQEESYLYAYNAIIPYCNENGFWYDLKKMSIEALREAINRYDDKSSINLKEEIKKDGSNIDKSFNASLKDKFKDLSDSPYPIIDKDIINPDVVWEQCCNTAFDSNSKEAYYAWLVYGKRYNKTINFILNSKRKGKDGKQTLAIAQLRRLIEKTTGNVDNTKDAFYKDVFGLEIKTAHIPASPNLNETFKELTSIIFKNKTSTK